MYAKQLHRSNQIVVHKKAIVKDHINAHSTHLQWITICSNKIYNNNTILIWGTLRTTDCICLVVLIKETGRERELLTNLICLIHLKPMHRNKEREWDSKNLLLMEYCTHSIQHIGIYFTRTCTVHICVCISWSPLLSEWFYLSAFHSFQFISFIHILFGYWQGARVASVAVLQTERSGLYFRLIFHCIMTLIEGHNIETFWQTDEKLKRKFSAMSTIHVCEYKHRHTHTRARAYEQNAFNKNVLWHSMPSKLVWCLQGWRRKKKYRWKSAYTKNGQ